MCSAAPGACPELVDVIDLSGESGGYTVDLAGNRANPALPSTITVTASLMTANHVLGGVGANILTGDHLGNSLIGGADNDTLTGGGGADTAGWDGWLR